MKPKSAFRLVRAGSRRLAIALVTLLAAQAVPADTIYWDGTGTDWALVGSWSTQLGATTPDPAFMPGAADLATFSISGVNTAQTVNLNGNRSVLGLSFLGSNTATTTLLGGGTARTLTLGTSGLTLATNAGAVTLGDGSTGNNVLIALASGDQTWTNNAAAAFTINNTAATFTRAVGATLDFNQAGAGAFAMSTTVLPNDATGIIGAWASFGTGSNTQYAYNNAGVIAGLTGTAAATAADVTDTTGVLNYDVAAVGVLGTGANFNTLRYTGAAGSITGTWTANGLMNVGGGLLTLSGAGTIGAGKELVVNTATANSGITFSSAIANNPLGASMLTKTGLGTLTLSGTSTYSGKTVINGGTLKITGGDTTTVGGAAPLGAYPSVFQADNVTINNGATFYVPDGTVVNPNRGVYLGAGNATIYLENKKSPIFKSVISGSGNLSFISGDTARAWFYAPMTYSGTTTNTVGSGTMGFGDAASISNDGSLVNSPSLILSCSAVWQNIGNTTYAGVISGSGSNNQVKYNGTGNNAAVALGDGFTAALSTAGRGMLTLTGANIYTVGTVINSGGITLAGSGNLGNNANALWIGYGVLDLGTKSIAQNGGVWLTDGTLKNGTLTSSGGFTLNSAGTNGGFVASANLAGGSALTKTGLGKATLSGTNTYTGITTLALGTLNLGSAETAGVSGPLGNPTTPANSIVLGGGTLQYSSANNFDYSSRFSTAASQAYNADTNGQSVKWAASLTSSGGSLTKTGAGTLTLTGTGNTYAGTTTVNGGMLLLDVNAGGTLSSSSALALGGGIFSIKGTGTTNQAVASLAVNAGGSGIAINPNGGTTTLTITSNTLTNAAASGVNFDTSAGTPSTAMIAWNPTLTGGIIGGGFTMTDNGGTGFATINTGKVVRFTPGTVLNATNPTSSTTDFLTNTTSTITNTVATAALNSLTIDTTAGANIWDLVTGNTATISTGGLLMTGANNFAIQNGTLMSGTATNSDLIVNQMGAGTLSISSLIANGTGASTLTKNGSGALVLNGGVANTYTGGTFVDAGTLTVNAYAANATGLGTGAVAIAAGGTLSIQSNGQVPTLANTFSGAGTLGLVFTGSNSNIAANNVSGLTGTIQLSRTDANNHVWSTSNTVFSAAVVIGSGTQLSVSAASPTFRKGITISGSNTFTALKYTGTMAGDITLLTDAVVAYQSSDINGRVTSNITSGAGSGTQTLYLYDGGDFRKGDNWSGTISDGSTGGHISIQSNNGGNDHLGMLTGNNTYTGETRLNMGILRANDGVGLPSTSNLNITGRATFETSANLLRSGGTGAGQMQLNGNVGQTDGANGFNAVINPVTVGFGSSISNAQATTLTWGTAPFQPTINTLALNKTWSNVGSYTATIGSDITFVNPINLGTTACSILVDYKTATMSGALTGTTATLTKVNAGALVLSGTNTYSGATNVNAGKLLLGAGGAMGATAVGVTGGATYGTSYTTSGNTIAGGASLSLANGTFLDLQDSTTNTLACTGAATLSGATLKFDLGANQADRLSLGATATTSAGNVIFLHMLGGTLVTGVGAYTLLSDSAGGLTLGNFGLASTTLGSYTLALSGGGNTIYLDVTGAGGGGTPTQSFTFSAPANPVNARPGVGVSVSGTLRNTGAGSLAVSLASTGTLSVTGLGSSVSPIANGAPGTVSGTIQTGTVAGPQVWGVTNTDGAATNTTATISGTINVYDLANAKYSGATLAFGNVHQGVSVSNQSVAIGNQTVTSAGYQDLLDVAASTGNAKVTATGFSGLAASTSGATTSNLSFSVNTATPGSLAGTASLTLTSNANSVAGLSNGTATVVGSPTAITTSGYVYSGQGVWNTDGNGNWNDFGKWTASGGAPGLDAGFTTADTATFDSAASANNATVTLNAVSPSLHGVTFNNSGKSYTLDATGGGSLVLSNGASDATLTNTAGSHTISAPITLASNLVVSGGGTSLTLAGVVTDGAGSFSLTKSGAGTLTLSNANTYHGGTLVNGTGTLLVNNTTGSGTGSGAVSVGAGATLGGSGSITGAVNVTGILSPGGASLESLATGALSLNSGSSLVMGTLYSTPAVADLMLVTGNLTLATLTAPTLTLTGLDGAWATGSRLTLLSYTGSLTGTFSGYADDTSYLFGSNYWMINYNAPLTAKGTNFAAEVPASGALLVTVTLDAYKTWGGAAAFSADSNNDGVANGLAWILGAANPSANSNALLPTASATSSSGLTLTFKRLQASIDQSTLVLEYSNSLASNSWTDVPISKDAGPHNYPNGVVVTVTQASPSDTISVNIPASNGPGKVFARLKATQP